MAAVGGAAVGARLGFGCTTGLAALITTIAGATAGANLTLIALDLAWAGSTRSRVGATASTIPSPSLELVSKRP
jgi:hypothetical protein